MKAFKLKIQDREGWDNRTAQENRDLFWFTNGSPTGNNAGLGYMVGPHGGKCKPGEICNCIPGKTNCNTVLCPGDNEEQNPSLYSQIAKLL